MMIEELKELTYIIVEIIKNQIRALMGKDFMSHLSSLAVPTGQRVFRGVFFSTTTPRCEFKPTRNFFSDLFRAHFLLLSH
jgi:hypothetical protein